MPSCNFITYKGVKLMYTDISGCSGTEAIPVFERTRELVGPMPDKSVLSLVNATDARFNSDLLATIRETVKANNPKIKATVVVGLSPLTTLIVNSIIQVTGRKMKLMKDLDEGKEWLLSTRGGSAVSQSA